MRSLLVPAVLTVSLAAVAPFATRADEPAKSEQSQVAIAQTFRAGDIIGLPVWNKANENIASIDDLVIDMKTGEVRYAAISRGSVAGIGGKLYAVPFSALTFVFGEPNKADSRHFVMDATKDQLDAAPGFETSHWPSVGDSQWGASIDKHYKVDRKIDAKADGAKITYETVFRASKIKGMDVRNDANDNLGSIDELVIDVTKGHVKYVALSYGSWFTGGNKLFALPLSACTLTHANEKTYFAVHASQEMLKNAPGFDKNQWPNTADANWNKSIDTYYERTTRRPTNQ
jgi:sporulation protein YlmC with PRC-barrel domain